MVANPVAPIMNTSRPRHDLQTSIALKKSKRPISILSGIGSVAFIMVQLVTLGLLNGDCLVSLTKLATSLTLKVLLIPEKNPIAPRATKVTEVAQIRLVSYLTSS